MSSHWTKPPSTADWRFDWRFDCRLVPVASGFLPFTRRRRSSDLLHAIGR